MAQTPFNLDFTRRCKSPLTIVSLSRSLDALAVELSQQSLGLLKVLLRLLDGLFAALQAHFVIIHVLVPSLIFPSAKVLNLLARVFDLRKA